MSRIREINIKSCTHYFFNDIINIQNVDINNINLDEKPYINILIYYAGYVALNSVKPMCLIINNVMNGYIEESNGNEFLILIFTNESKDKLKKFEEICKIKNLTRSANNNSGDYDEKYGNLPLKKIVEFYDIIIVVRSVSSYDN